MSKIEVTATSAADDAVLEEYNPCQAAWVVGTPRTRMVLLLESQWHA